MQTQQQSFEILKTNAHGASIRAVTVYTSERVIELSYQQVLGRWVQYKRIVRTVH